MAMLEDILAAERIVTALVLLTGMGVAIFCYLCPSRRISFAVVGIASVLAFGAISATFFNPKAEFSAWDAENPEFSGRSRTGDGRATIRLRYRLENAVNGKYLISGKLKIHDSMTGKEWTAAAQSSMFITGCESTGTFELLYALPKELADRSMDATYTVRYASGYSETRKRYILSYARKTRMHIFTDPMLKISRTGKPKDRVVSETPDED